MRPCCEHGGSTGCGCRNTHSAVAVLTALSGVGEQGVLGDAPHEARSYQVAWTSLRGLSWLPLLPLCLLKLLLLAQRLLLSRLLLVLQLS